jgi:hypothetical protein
MFGLSLVWACSSADVSVVISYPNRVPAPFGRVSVDDGEGEVMLVDGGVATVAVPDRESPDDMTGEG